jgi:hypothetical protein
MVFFIPFWIFLFFLYNLFFDTKRSRNFVSFVHSIICTQTNDIPMLTNLSISYFIYDTVYILLNSFSKEKIYIYHHIVVIMGLTEMYNTESDLLLRVLQIGEKSNFLLYVVYDLIHTNCDAMILSISKIIQFFWYSYYRVFVLTQILYDNYDYFSQLTIFYPILSLYLVGLGWSCAQLKKLVL